MLCDGRIVCGCADPYGTRVLGDTRTSSLHDIWTGPVAAALREDLNRGGSKFCGDCPLKLPLAKDQAALVRDLDVPPQPSRLYVECTAACNISCFQACCAPETGITRTRQAGMLDFDLFTRVIDEAGPGLGRVDFFNYGEAFLHKRADEMCEYIKARFPHIYLYTSTNGLALKEEGARTGSRRRRRPPDVGGHRPPGRRFSRRFVPGSPDYARAWLPHTIDGGAQAAVPIEIPVPAEAGRYQLKFDLVSEGIDWFEACGSQTTMKTLGV